MQGLQRIALIKKILQRIAPIKKAKKKKQYDAWSKIHEPV